MPLSSPYLHIPREAKVIDTYQIGLYDKNHRKRWKEEKELKSKM
jgi:hypothetical protein